MFWTIIWNFWGGNSWRWPFHYRTWQSLLKMTGSKSSRWLGTFSISLRNSSLLILLFQMSHCCLKAECLWHGWYNQSLLSASTRAWFDWLAMTSVKICFVSSGAAMLNIETHDPDAEHWTYTAMIEREIFNNLRILNKVPMKLPTFTHDSQVGDIIEGPALKEGGTITILMEGPMLTSVMFTRTSNGLELSILLTPTDLVAWIPENSYSRFASSVLLKLSIVISIFISLVLLIHLLKRH